MIEVTSTATRMIVAVDGAAARGSALSGSAGFGLASITDSR
jgi:hypothetical protein